ncbi:MAG: hypothetical protein ACXVH2_10190 [Methanobacterium sp.]
MVDIKEIKSVKLTPFTRMSASIYAILGFVAAIALLIVLTIVQAVGLIPPQLGQFNLAVGVGIPLIVILPIGAFLITVTVSFISAMLYNLLVPKLGGIRLEFDGIDVVKIPVISFALILSAIGAIWAFIAGLLMAAFITPIFSLITNSPLTANITANLTNTTGSAIPSGLFSSAGIILALVLVIGLPILVFVFGFIWNALFAIFYNYIVTRVVKIKLEFAKITESLYELKQIPVIPTALAVALVFTLLGIISGILSGNYGQFITNFFQYFIETAIIALSYNYLAPKIGSIKLNLE